MRADRSTVETDSAHESAAPIILRWFLATLLALGVIVLILLAGLIT